MALGLFDTPLPRPTRPGLFKEMAQYRSAPGIARSQSRAAAYDRLAQLPENILGTATKFNQFREVQMNLRPTKQVSPALAAAYPEIADVPFGKAKDLLPALLTARKTDTGNVLAMTGAAALKAGKIPRGTRIIDVPKSPDTDKPLSSEAAKTITTAESGIVSIDKALEILDKDPNAARKLASPVASALKIGNKELQRLDRAMFNATDALLRKRTGAVAPEPEVRRYVNSILGGLTTNPSVVREALEEVRDELRGLSREVRPGRELTPSPKGSAQQLKTKSGIPYSIE